MDRRQSRYHCLLSSCDMPALRRMLSLYLILTKQHGVGTISVPILDIRKLGHRRVKSLATVTLPGDDGTWIGCQDQTDWRRKQTWVQMLIRLPGTPSPPTSHLTFPSLSLLVRPVWRAGIIVRTKRSRCSLVIQQVLIGHLVCARHWASVSKQN